MSPLDKRADRVAQVKAQVDYHRQRLVLYQRLHGSQPGIRLAELEHAYRSARERFAGATDPNASGPGASTRPPLD